ncbi:amino acid ABC transporter substrate-binding protein [Kordia sp. YSTF-M3]|uniref:Amino acid ABC transporter substrate-binding protein n=1 Tax=Kordia aestuariivivens TaxID=2759037 RepID=A0ABR7QEM0_9FLAO|nr:ABC transporter substrate-binding protein [Kordia aestuariivivens]MBC8756878.1 amino acid ABC transporter substrate-binding protein [Kordia aestuariivivens]
MIRIGATADLSLNGSIHQDTFVDAIKLAWSNLAFDEKKVELIWENDFASEAGGVQAATNLIKRGAHFVIGHYSSTAAKHALPFYVKKNIPVFLPAATSDILTEKFDCAFRICGKDSDLADLITNEISEKKAHTLYVGYDQSIHGVELSSLVLERLSKVPTVTIVDKLSEAKNVLFIGNFKNSIDFAKKNYSELQHTDELYFTDDLVHPELINSIGFRKPKIFVFGYTHASKYIEAKQINDQYYNSNQKYPFTFFLETYAALEIINKLLSLENSSNEWMQLLKQNKWETVVGNIRFGFLRESMLQKYALWQLENAKFEIAHEFI